MLEQKEREHRKRKKLLIFLFTSVITTIVLAVPTLAAELEPPIDGEQPWGWPLDGIYNSIREMLYSLVCNILNGAFSFIDGVTQSAGYELGKTPQDYNGAVFSLITNVSHNVIIPIATVILAYVIIADLITMVMDKNNFHDFDTSLFFRWIMKAGAGILFLSNSDKIVNAFFDLGSMMIDGLNSESVQLGTMSAMTSSLEESLAKFGIGTYVSLIIPVGLLDIVSIIIYVCVYVILIGRMMEIYVYMSIAPIPMATLMNREIGSAGKDYLRTIFAFVLQAFFIFLCIVIYKALIFSLAEQLHNLTITDASNATWDVSGYMFQIMAYGIVLILTMFKSGSIAKSIVGAR